MMMARDHLPATLGEIFKMTMAREPPPVKLGRILK
jgi:hypothetical protein